TIQTPPGLVNVQDEVRAVPIARQQTPRAADDRAPKPFGRGPQHTARLEVGRIERRLTLADDVAREPHALDAQKTQDGQRMIQQPLPVGGSHRPPHAPCPGPSGRIAVASDSTCACTIGSCGACPPSSADGDLMNTPVAERSRSTST